MKHFVIYRKLILIIGTATAVVSVGVVLFYGGHPFPYAFYLFCICIFMWLVVPNGLSAQPL